MVEWVNLDYWFTVKSLGENYLWHAYMYSFQNKKWGALGCHGEFTRSYTINFWEKCNNIHRTRNKGAIAQFDSRVGEISQSPNTYISLASNCAYLKMK